MSEPQETRKPNRFRITSIIIAVAFLLPTLSVIDFKTADNEERSLTNAPQSAHIQTGAILTGTTQTAYAYQCDFSTPLDSGWIKVGSTTPPNGFSIVDSELQILAGWDGNGERAQHYFNLSKQDFTVSFNYRMAQNVSIPPASYREIFNLTAEAYNGIYLGNLRWGLGLFIRTNYSLQIVHDVGTKIMTYALASTYPAKLGNATNYQFTVQFNRTTDTAWVRVLNKTSSTYLVNAQYTTFCTSNESNLPIPDRFSIGTPTSSSCNVFYDNITITYTQAVHGSTSVNIAALQTAISSFATVLRQAERNSTYFELGKILTIPGWNWYGALEPYIASGSRDDVVGDMISSLCSLYQYSGDSRYLTEAEQMWVVLQTHQQPDMGFTFADNNTDFGDTMGRIMLGLMSLYEVTGNNTYLSDALAMAPTLIKYQVNVTSGPGGICAGSVYFWHQRTPSAYGVQNMVYSTAYFAVTMLELYKFSGNATIYHHALMALDCLLNWTTYTGYIWNSGWGFGTGGPNAGYEDYNDVVNAGLGLWAMSEGYKVTHDATYLTAAQKMANYLVRSEFTKDGKCWGAWSGVVDERFNQSSLVYNYGIQFGLKSYLDIAPMETTIRNTYNASINFWTSIQGMTASSDGPLYNTTGKWASAVSFNDSANPKWSPGWWDEGGWGTWGLITFYGWQANVIKALTSVESENGQNPYSIYVHSMVINSGTDRFTGVFSSSMNPTSINYSSPTNCAVFVHDCSSSGASWYANATSGTAVTFTLSGLESGRMYRLYIDGTSSQLLTASGGGVISFTYSGPWSEHEFEVRPTAITDSVAPLVNLIFVMFGIGVVVGVIVEGTYSLRKKEMLNSQEMIKSVITMVIYIVIGIASLGVLYSIVA